MDLLCFGLVIVATVLLACFCYEVLKSKSTLLGTNPNLEENFRTLLSSESEFRNLSVLYKENYDLKNKILLAETDLAKVMTERNEIASQREQLMAEIRDWQEKYDSYEQAMTNKLKEYDARREEYEKGKEELVSTMLQVREKNEARFKVKIEALQAALTTEHMRSTASLNQELQALSELQVGQSRIAELELTNKNQRNRIAELESKIASFGEQRPRKASINEEAPTIDLIPKKKIWPEGHSPPDKTEIDFKVISGIQEEELEDEYILSMIAARDYGRIIGPKGKNIKDLQDAYGVIVLTSLPHGPNDKVRVTIKSGNRNSRRTVANKILDNLPVQVEVRTDAIRYLSDENIKKLQRRFFVDIENVKEKSKCLLSGNLINCRKLFAQEKLLS